MGPVGVVNLMVKSASMRLLAAAAAAGGEPLTLRRPGGRTPVIHDSTELLGGVKKCQLEGSVVSVDEYFEWAEVDVEGIAAIRYPGRVRLALLLRNHGCRVDVGGVTHEGIVHRTTISTCWTGESGFARGDGGSHCARNQRS